MIWCTIFKKRLPTRSKSLHGSVRVLRREKRQVYPTRSLLLILLLLVLATTLLAATITVLFQLANTMTAVTTDTAVTAADFAISNARYCYCYRCSRSCTTTSIATTVVTNIITATTASNIFTTNALFLQILPILLLLYDYYLQWY